MLINTYSELWAINAGQITAGKILCSNSIFTKNGREDVELSNKLRQDIAKKLTHQIGGRKQSQVERFLNFNTVPYHWALDRFILSISPKGVHYWTYCAGQDGTWEMNELRRFIYVH